MPDEPPIEIPEIESLIDNRDRIPTGLKGQHTGAEDSFVLNLDTQKTDERVNDSPGRNEEHIQTFEHEPEGQEDENLNPENDLFQLHPPLSPLPDEETPPPLTPLSPIPDEQSLQEISHSRSPMNSLTNPPVDEEFSDEDLPVGLGLEDSDSMNDLQTRSLGGYSTHSSYTTSFTWKH